MLRSLKPMVPSRPAGHLAGRGLVFFLLSLLLLGSGPTRAQSIDPTFNPTDAGFNPGTGTSNGSVNSVVLQGDGKVLTGGFFTTYNGMARNGIARLNANGSLDASFNPGTGANGTVTSVALQEDGRVLIGGFFTTYNGMARNGIARLNANGSLDTGFDPGTGTSNGLVTSVVVQGDSKVLIGGAFTSYNGTARNSIARLNADGSLDQGFNPGSGANDFVYSVALQRDGKILIGGSYTRYNGMARNGIAQLNADGSLDQGFNPGSGANNYVRSVAVQGDGRVLIGGDFTSYNGMARNRIARLNADGSLDTGFNPGTGADDTIGSVAVQGDGQVLIGGTFTSYNGRARNRIARLNADGSLDAGFDPGTGANNYVRSVAVQEDGRVLIGGAFTSYNGTARNGIARLNADGSLDTGSGGGANNLVRSVAVQGDGRVLIGGEFTSYNGTIRNRIARLNTDGSLDTSFNPGSGANGLVTSVALQGDGKVLIGGEFTSYNGTARNRIARLNTDGSLDPGFNPGSGANGTIGSVAVQGDGRVLIGGDFASYNGTARNRIARLNADGSLDKDFNPGAGADNFVTSVAVQGDGKVLIGGFFTSYNGTARNSIARLNADGSLDQGFNPGSGANDFVYSVALQRDGRMLIGGVFTSYNDTARNRIARLNADGSLDKDFNPGTGADGPVRSVALQGDGKVLIGGFFTSYNGAARNRIARLNADGSLDKDFNPGTGADGPVRSVALQGDGKVLIGGVFTSYNGTVRNRIARLLNDATPPTIARFTANTDPVCSGSLVSFTATVGNTTGTYGYTLTNGTSPLTGTASSSAFSQTLTASGSGRQSFTLIVSNNGQLVTAVAPLTVDVIPVASLTNNGPLSCALTTVTLTGSGADNGDSYRFSSGATQLNGGNTARVNMTGTYSVTVTSASGCTAVASTSVTSNTAMITANNPATTTVILGSAFSQRFTASGGVSPYSFSLISGSLPAGLSLSSAGLLSGTPTQSGSFSITVQARDASGCSGMSATYVLTVSEPAPVSPIRYVKQGGIGDGSSWASASGDLQSQIDLTGARQVWVAAGTYRPGNSFSMKNEVAIYGGFAGSETQLSQRPAVNPITGSPSSATLTTSSTSGAVVYNNGNALTGSAVLDGFVIAGGNNSTGFGGGIYNRSSSPTLTNCAITNNSADNGFGGGIFNQSSSPALTNCTITNNSADNGFGGGIFNQSSSSPTLTNCAITNNSAGNGGGIFNQSSSPTLTNCAITNNSTGGSGGGILNDTSNPTLTNCLLAGNTANLGGALRNDKSSRPTLTNCTLTANRAGSGAALINDVGSQPVLTNTILYDNQESSGKSINNDTGSGVTADYCLIGAGEGDYTGSGPTNLTATASPFADGTNYQLNPCSVAINAGNPASTTATSGATDLAGNPRFYQNGRIDMGAYEYQGSPAQPVAITGQPASNSSVTVGASISVPVSVSGSVSGYQWYKDNLNSPVTNQTSATLTLTNVHVSDAGSYSLVVSGTCNPGMPASVTSTAFSLSVSPAQPTLSGFMATPNSVCVGSPVTFTATVGNVSGSYTYTLSDGSSTTLGSGSNMAFSQRLVASGSGPQNFTLTVSANNGQVVTATTSLMVNTPPTATLSASPSATLTCAQTSLTLTAGAGSSYTFSGPGIVTQDGNTALVNQTGTYSVVASDRGCSSDAATITVTGDKTTPTANLSNNGPLSCTMTSVTLSASGAGNGGTYRFSNGAAQTDSGDGNTAAVNTAGPYSVTVTSSNGCTSVASTTVTGNQTPPTVSITSTSGTLTCASPSLTLTANTSALTLRWSNGQTTPSITVNVSGTYSVTATGTNGCSATSNPVIIESAQEVPPATLLASGGLSCAVTSVTLTANTGSGLIYRFSAGATQLGNDNTATVSASGTYSVTVTNTATGCTNTTSVVVGQDNAAPSASLASSGPLSCNVSSVTLTASGGSTYRFSNGASPIGTTNQATVTTAGFYSVTVLAGNGCSSVASTTVTGDQTVPTVSISPRSATLSCGLPRASLTANTSASSLTWSTGQTTNSISVSVAGTYSVTVTSANGCQAVAQATVSGTTDAPTAPTLAASPATTTSGQPITVTANGCTGGTITWTALGGTGQASGNTYTLTQPGNYTLSATCSLNGCTSPSSAPLALQIRPGGFAITGVSMVSCQLVDEAKGGYRVQFTPQYAGQSDSPISFSVVNELATTTTPAPYSLRLYTDNPVITLVATQAGNGEARFAYNWLASCQSGTSPNRPPTTMGIPSQTIVQGQAYQLTLTSYFTDPDGQALTFQASGLPAGLSLSGSVISGTPSQTGVTSVNVTAIDPGGLQVSTSFQLTVSPMPVTPPTGFAIVNVATVSCQVLSAGERRLTFTPQYAGVSGGPISFSVVNELVATTAPGPYTLRLYTDNPAITLSAQQGSAVSSYRYNWLAVCNPAGRVGLSEAESMLVVRVLGNPLTGDVVQVQVQGADGQPVQVSLTNLQGQLVSEMGIQQAGQVELLSLPVASQPAGLLMLRVSTPTQNQTLKVLKR